MVALITVAPFVAYPFFVMQALCFALFACAFNLLVGYTGLLSFGHAAFFGTAAYVAGHAIKVWGLPTELGLLAGTGAAALLGWAVGSLAIRRTGIYFAMVTLALAQMVYFFFLQASFTGGEDGLQGVPRGTLLGFIDLADDLKLYYFVLAIFILFDPTQYLMIDKGAVQAASSMHVRFLTDEMTYRWVLRVGGQIWWKTALTAFKGTTTYSPIITLATRS